MSETKKKSPSGKFTGGPAMSRELLLEQEVNKLQAQIATMSQPKKWTGKLDVATHEKIVKKLEAQVGLKETEVSYHLSEATFYKSRSAQLDKYMRNTERELAQSQLELQLALLKVETVVTVLTKMLDALKTSSPKMPTFEHLAGEDILGGNDVKGE